MHCGYSDLDLHVLQVDKGKEREAINESTQNDESVKICNLRGPGSNVILQENQLN